MRRNVLLCSLLIVLAGVWISLPSSPSFALSPDDYFKIKVVDAETGRGVPLVKLRTTNDIRFYTDSAGVVAIHEPGLMGREVWFEVDAHGYTFSGTARHGGIRIDLNRGGSKTIEIQRTNVAERLYRITGLGLYRDSKIFGNSTPLQEPLVNSGNITAQDSIVNAVYRDKIYWFWGDTGLFDRRLGVFKSTGAVSDLPDSGGLNPSKGVNLDYFVDTASFARPMFPNIENTVWPSYLTVVRDETGKQQLYGAYLRRNKTERLEQGIAKWDNEARKFQKVATFPLDRKVKRCGQTVRVRAKGKEWFYLPCPVPGIRVRARADSITNYKAYQAFTPLEPGSSWDTPTLEGSPDDPVWDWKAEAPSLHNNSRLIKLIQNDMIDTRALTDVRTGTLRLPKTGTVYWNEYRQKWIMIHSSSPFALEKAIALNNSERALSIAEEILSKGRSFLGEIWYAEADSPLGPWIYSRRVVTHDNYSCYGVKQHRMFGQQGGRTIFFECTYSRRFTLQRAPTDRYNNNQVMYRLDLSDTRLHLPAPVYSHPGDSYGFRYDTMRGLENGNVPDVDRTARQSPIPFYALPPDRSKPTAVPVWETLITSDSGGDSVVELTLTKPASTLSDSPVFYAFPPDSSTSGPHIVPVYEYEHATGDTVVYSPDHHSQYPPPGESWNKGIAVFKAWRSPNLMPPRDPGTRPVKTCTGSSAVCGNP